MITDHGFCPFGSVRNPFPNTMFFLEEDIMEIRKIIADELKRQHEKEFNLEKARKGI